MPTPEKQTDFQDLAARIKRAALDFGFQQAGITHTRLEEPERRLQDWLSLGRHGDMEYMARHGTKRSRPAELVPGTLSVISVRMDYLPEPRPRSEAQLATPGAAFVSRYALGRDYHKLMRKRLQRLADHIAGLIGPFGHRVFVDSAPVLEKALAEQAGLGWIGKHTLLINRGAGSWFFLGEIFTDLPLPPDPPAASHCGRCDACQRICPTQAIVAPYQLDARRCISYLTIELHGAIPVELRCPIGHRIFGCDDCQQVCPWNHFARLTREEDFLPRHGLDNATLLGLFDWDEATFLKRTEGSPIRRIGHLRWLRNLAVALGNAPTRPEIVAALQRRLGHASELVREHVLWALEQHQGSRRK